jgi:predicted ATPase
MRIAMSGAHRTGKTTLVAALAELLPDHQVVEEPYRLLEEDGFEFASPPTLEDFEAQLERSIASVLESAEDALFDRCPVDLLAYLLVHPDADAFDLEEWVPRARAALERLELVVFVPIESPDRIVRASSEEDDGRSEVDEKVREILLEDPFDLGLEVLEVSGDVGARARRVLARLR